MNYPIKIVGFVIDVHNLTMYQADGETLTIAQGDPRVKDLVAKLVAADTGIAPYTYWLQAEDFDDRNHFADTEKKMGGVVRFFKMVKTKAKELLDKFVEPLPPMEVGTKKEMVHIVDGVEQEEEFPEPPAVVLPPEEERPLTQSAAAVAEIMANAIPATTKGFSTPDIKEAEETTILAVLEDNTIIPGCEALALQVASVSEGAGSSTGMENFLRRAGTIKRGHSVEDLLKFVQKGDLPLADDGSVLVYKLLNKTSEEGVFVDCHSGNVKQKVGSFVHMEEKLVDANRRKDCSNGLHVARRDYLRSFSGNVCVLAKLAPEDVIAVPEYDARKLRAKGYHIIAQLSDRDRDLVKGNNPMQDQVLLGNAIAGNHVGILEMVEITMAKGGGLVVRPVEGEVKDTVELDASLKGDSLDHLPLEDNPEACVVDARAVALSTARGNETTTASQLPAGGYADGDLWKNGNGQMAYAPPSNMQVISRALDEAPKPVTLPVPEPKAKLTVLQQLLNDWAEASTDEERLSAAQALLHFKKQAKKSWTALGVDIKVWEKAIQVVADAAMIKAVAAAPVKKLKGAVQPKAKVTIKDNGNGTVTVKAKAAKGVDLRDVIGKPTTKSKVKPVETTLKAPPVPKAPGKRSQKEEAQHLLDIYTKNPDYINCKQLVAFKKASKKGWAALGIPEATGKKAEARVKV